MWTKTFWVNTIEDTFKAMAAAGVALVASNGNDIMALLDWRITSSAGAMVILSALSSARGDKSTGRFNKAQEKKKEKEEVVDF